MKKRTQKNTPTVRDREATIKAILEAAETVFAQHGLRGARTDDIAAIAGVVRGLIFYYFETKEKLYMAVWSEHINRSALFSKKRYRQGNLPKSCWRLWSKGCCD